MGELVVVAQRTDLVDALADDVEAHHHLDGVIAELLGVLEGMGGGLGVDRRARECEQGCHVGLSRSH
jgi:hypothetical protein